MRYLLRSEYRTLSPNEQVPRQIDVPFFQRVSLQDIADKELKGWERLSPQSMKVTSHVEGNCACGVELIVPDSCHCMKALCCIHT